MSDIQRPQSEIAKSSGPRWRYWAAGLVAFPGLIFFSSIYSTFEQWHDPMGSASMVSPYVFHRFKDSKLRSDVVDRIMANSSIIRGIGEYREISSYGLIGGRLWEFGPFGQTEWSFQLNGTTGTSIVHVTATKLFRTWTIQHLFVDIADQRFVVSPQSPNPSFNPDAASASHRPILPRRYGSAG